MHKGVYENNKLSKTVVKSHGREGEFNWGEVVGLPNYLMYID